MAFIIHKLGPEGYGQWTAATALLATGAILTSLGLRGAFVRAVAAAPEIAGEALAAQLGLRLLLTVLASALVVGACAMIGYPGAVLWCTVIGAAGIALTTVATTLGDVLQALHRAKTLAGVGLAAGLVLTGLSVIVAWRGGGPVAIAAAYLSGPAVSAVSLWAAAGREIGAVRVRWDLRAFARLLKGARYFAAQQALAAVSAQAESLLAPRLIGLNQFGFFSAGAMPANRLTVLPDGLCTAAYPAMVQECARGEGRGGALVLRIAALAAASGAALALGLTLLAEPIGRLLFPSQPEPFAAVVRVTIWALPLVGVESVLGYALNAAGREAAQAKASVPAAAVSLLASVALISMFGVAGACWSMVLRPAIRGAFLLPVALRTFGATATETVDGEPALAIAEPLLRKAG